ncbi:MAG: hypothetical protein KDD52_01895 [Bdellovibrionales bacterium]|nr:hypothetical protein [Bdellovibrionales bacterium]
MKITVTVALLVGFLGVGFVSADPIILAQYEDQQANLLEIPSKKEKKLNLGQGADVAGEVESSSEDQEQRKQLLSQLKKLYEQNKKDQL